MPTGVISLWNRMSNTLTFADSAVVCHRTPASASYTRSGRTRDSGPTKSTLVVSTLSKPANMSFRVGSRPFDPYDAYRVARRVASHVTPTLGFTNVHAMLLPATPACASGTYSNSG